MHVAAAARCRCPPTWTSCAVPSGSPPALVGQAATAPKKLSCGTNATRAELSKDASYPRLRS
jgi:hypothetical protein